MNTIATIEVDRISLINQAFSMKRLKQTRNSPTGALMRLVDFIKSEDGKTFDIHNIVLGDKDDNFLFLYYANGIRYKIFKNGDVFITSADTQEDMSRQEEEFNKVINTILADEIIYRIKQSIAKDTKYSLKTGKSKPRMLPDNKNYEKIAMMLSD